MQDPNHNEVFHAILSFGCDYLPIPGIEIPPLPSLETLPAYVVGAGFIFRLPPVSWTLTNRRVYVMRFLARPLGVFFFSCLSTSVGRCQCEPIVANSAPLLFRLSAPSIAAFQISNSMFENLSEIGER